MTAAPHHELALTVIGVYLVLLLVLGVVAKRFVHNTADYFRSGCRGTWWLAGSSIFMGNFSAWTFTGAAAMAFDAGWSILAIYLFAPITALIQAWLVAARFRQLRATTMPEVIRKRWGPVTQQFYAVVQITAQFIVSAIALYGLSIFISAFFAIPVSTAILILGVVVLVYSTIGGSWAVMLADYVQSLLVVGMVAITAGLSLWHLGGVSGLFEKIQAQGLAQNFSFFKPAGAFPLDKFTVSWLIGLAVLYLFDSVSLTNSVRYFVVKDGCEARKAALFLALLSMIGIALWFLPPIAGRLLFSEEVLKTALDRPAEGAFAVTSMILLPAGMAGLLGVAIISTTLSSMDHGLNRNAAIIVREIYPAICRLFGWPEIPESRQLVLSRWVSLAAGAGIMGISLLFATQKKLGIFDIMQAFTSLVALPMTVPMALALIFRKVPSGAALVSLGCGLLVSLTGLLSNMVWGHPWTFHFSTIAVTAACILGFFATRPFWKRSSPEYQEQVRVFFQTMERPVDFAKEVGHESDETQLRLMGWFTMTAGGLSALLLFTAKSSSDVLLILLFCGFLWTIALGMLLAAWRRKKRYRAVLPLAPLATSEGVPEQTVSQASSRER